MPVLFHSQAGPDLHVQVWATGKPLNNTPIARADLNNDQAAWVSTRWVNPGA